MNEIKLGSVVEVKFGGRAGKVVSIEDKNDEYGTRYTIEFGNHDFLNGFEPLNPGKVFTGVFILDEISKVF